MTGKDIIESVLDLLGIKAPTLADTIGVKYQRLYDIQKGKVKKLSSEVANAIAMKYPEISLEWLLTGKGDMIIGDDIRTATNSESEEEQVMMIPIIHIDSVGGIHSANDIIEESQYIEGYAPFTDARAGDICIVQSGDSMVPTCPSGSLLLLRQVPQWQEYFGYGNIFVIELKDGRRITKEVTRYDENPKDYIWCVSHNPSVPDEELPKSMIRSVWKVIKILINKGW